MGGMVAAIEKGFPQREIQDSAYQYQKAVEAGEQMIVGVNKYQMEQTSTEIPTLVIDESVRGTTNSNVWNRPALVETTRRS